MLHELERAEEVDEDEDDKGEKATRIEGVRGRSWGEDEPAQCLSRPVGSVIPFVVVCFQSGDMFHAVTVGLLQTASRTVCEGGVSEPGRYFKPLIDVMLLDKAKSGGSTKQGNVMGVALVHSPTRVSPPKSAENPPPYGAQHRQDALWKEVGGNEALPPRWQQFELGDDDTQYQDDNLVMVSLNRPLPGVRLGRSYFVNHNTQTTSRKKPVPDRPEGSLTPDCIIEDHSECIWSLVCVGTSCNVMSASEDGSICQWVRAGEPVGEPWRSDGRAVVSLAVSPDQTMVVSGSEDGKLRLWNMEEGNVVGDPWKGHNAAVRWLDWSPDDKEIASGSQDGTIRRWNPKTGRQIAPPIETGHRWVYAVKYSPQGDKFASGGEDGVIQDGAHIFSASRDFTIRKWSIDGKELVVLRGHTNSITSICLTGDESHLVSASLDCSVRIWDLKTNEQVGDPLWHDDELLALAISSDEPYIASAGKDRKVYVWSIEAALQHDGNQVHPNHGAEQMRWDEAIHSAHKVIERNPSSYRGYELKHAALHGAQRYDEAIEAFHTMLSKLDHISDPQMQNLRQQYLSPSDAEVMIRQVVHAQIENFPPRLFHTTTGLLHDRNAQINVFETSTQYKELLSLTMKHADRRLECIEEVVMTYFRYAMLSHRWEEQEPLLHDIQGKAVYKLELVGGVHKLQSFCRVARDAGYRWAWSDTCCIDKTNNVELQESVITMFVWYSHSALTIIYLSDVLPLSKPGALAASAWNKRGWTVQEFLAPKVAIFYQKDWSLYLDDRSPNHKESLTIMQELVHATGIDTSTLVAFRPGMKGAREKLQWASTRTTTLQEDIAYSLFGIFGVRLPVIYGEKKQDALGRLLQQIIAQSGDITALDWVGKSSQFNSCLPADITSYEVPPFAPPSPSEHEIQTTVSSLRNTAAVELALNLYTTLRNLPAPRFAHCRLHLPCIVFPVAALRRRHDQDQVAPDVRHEVKAEGLNDLLITTEDKLIPFPRTKHAFLLVRPWDRDILYPVPDSAPDSTDSDDTQGVDDINPPESRADDWFHADHGPDDSESHTQALRLIVRLGQPFGVFLLAQQRGGEYKRIASDHDIIAQVTDMASVRCMMDVRTLEIL
ncbi:WD40 repeat-like protein [Rhizopogon salebrosus TDB-379]|nr:WD40 repeat-like protein [Rhizopogon salebrosus TDB-379]